MFSSNTTQVAADGGYQIARSLRFNSADTAYLNRTPASATNRQTWTWSAWVKRGSLGTTQILFVGGQDSSNYTNIYFSGSVTDNLELYTYTSGATAGYYYTASVFRDPSAWYHIVYSVDTTDATAANRVKIYVNSVLQTATVSNAFTQNANTWVNSANPHYLGRNQPSSQYFDGYMTEVNFIDGQALTPSSFGETDTQTGVWKPKAYSGSYGTNGFYLNFSDNSNNTSTTLGKDYSGNGNNWTPNGFLVTAGAGNDSLVDVPTSYGVDTGVGGTVRGNYATLNPLSVLVGTTSNGNLDGDTGTTNGGVVYATMNIPNSGKWYWEYTQTNTGTSYSGIETVVSSTSGSISNIVRYIGDGTKQVDGTTSSYGASYGNTDIIGTAVDVDAGTVTFYKNGTSQGAITYATASINIAPSWRDGSGSASLSFSANFGQRPFAYTAPSGFKALCTQNLPTPTIGATTATQAGKYFNTVLYTGNSSTLAVTGVGFQPDWVWGKCRSTALSHRFFDAVRGVTNRLISNNTSAEATESGVTAFNSDGFTLGSDQGLNFASDTYVAWNWKANGSGSTNTAGSITSTVSANTTSGFSVATFTTQASGTATIGHGLGVAPSMIIQKIRNLSGAGWFVYHSAIGNTQILQLESTNAAATNSTIWNNTSPTSSVWTIGSGWAGSYSTVAYCFAEVAGYSKFGSYTGNGSADGPFVFTGMRPAYVMIKRTNSSGTSWNIYDTTRIPSNVSDDMLFADLAIAELANETTLALDILSNGFKLRTTGTSVNGSGDTYIYMAFASAPFKYSLAR